MTIHKKARRKLKRIHVNQHVIRSNRKNGEAAPVLTVKEGGSNTYASEVEILDEDGVVVAAVVYRPEHPLSCGAQVWVESRNELRVVR